METITQTYQLMSRPGVYLTIPSGSSQKSVSDKVNSELEEAVCKVNKDHSVTIPRAIDIQ